MRFVGFTSSGTVCYYGGPLVTDPGQASARDLVQFIPRAFVFVAVVALYSKLYKFLRRPDTIQLSSQFDTGLAADLKDSAATKVFKPLTKIGRLPSSKSLSKQPLNSDAPWEQLEFVTVRSDRGRTVSPTATHTSHFNPVSSFTGGIFASSRPPTRPPSPNLESTESNQGANDHIARKRYASPTSTSTPPMESESTLDSGRPSEVETPLTPVLRYHPTDITINIIPNSPHILSPILSQGKGDVDFDVDLEDKEDLNVKNPEERRASGQTLQEFFQDYPVAQEDEARGELGKGGIQMSASTYFNRQASLLMLYFPIAVSFSSYFSEELADTGKVLDSLLDITREISV